MVVAVSECYIWIMPNPHEQRELLLKEYGKNIEKFFKKRKWLLYLCLVILLILAYEIHQDQMEIFRNIFGLERLD